MMFSDPRMEYGEIISATYKQVPHPSQQGQAFDALVIEVEGHHGTEEFALPNGHYDANNPCLRLMAFLGVKPSDGEEAMVGLDVPVIYDVETGYHLYEQAIDYHGFHALQKCDWFVTDSQTNGEVTDSQTNGEVTDDE